MLQEFIFILFEIILKSFQWILFYCWINWRLTICCRIRCSLVNTKSLVKTDCYVFLMFSFILPSFFIVLFLSYFLFASFQCWASLVSQVTPSSASPLWSTFCSKNLNLLQSFQNPFKWILIDYK